MKMNMVGRLLHCHSRDPVDWLCQWWDCSLHRNNSFEPAADLQVDESTHGNLLTQQVWCGNLLKCDCKAQKVPNVLHYDMEGVHNRMIDVAKA